MKFFYSLLLINLTLPLSRALAAIAPGTVPSPGDFGITTPIIFGSTTKGLVAIVTKLVAWTYTILFIVAILYILFAAFTYLTAAGDTEKVKKARQQLIYAAIAIAIAFLAVSAQLIILDFLSSP